MARIRSIKPEFWKSEAIAAHSFRARLTFIGLWTYVDDNGVGLDNPKLIAAELFALEEDPRETLANVREDLARLHEAGRIRRYTVAGKAFVAIVNWAEHQKIDKPAKPRYPGPDDPDAVEAEPSTSENPDPREGVAKPSRRSRESRAESSRLEQGSGSRGTGDQGSGSPPSAALAPLPPDATITQRSKRITDEYHAVEPMCNWPAINGVVIKAIKSQRFTDDEIRDAVLRLAKEGRPVTVESLRVELAGLPPRNGHKPSTTDQRVAEGLALAARLDAQEAR